MKIVQVHYHLKTGGVTTVLTQQVEAIQNDCDVLVVSGEAPPPDFPAKTIVVPELAYDYGKPFAQEPEKTAEAVSEAIFSTWKDGCDVVHVHNPTLAKNQNFLKILKNLQQGGFALFLQIHDFAEDGRPNVYYADESYPENCHYGVINSRDYEILRGSGLKAKGLHYLFNMIRPFSFAGPDLLEGERILYPVRAIRRKNIGEAILLSLFFEKPLNITQPPNSPVDFPFYRQWQDFVKRVRLNVAFEMGLKNDFEHLVRSSEFMITTSIAEGFGFSFLEPWTGNKLLQGRRLDANCSDFEKNGISLGHLYGAIRIPMDWIDQRRFFEAWQGYVRESFLQFRQPVSEVDVVRDFEKITAHGLIDFAKLDESFQQAVIERALSHPKDRSLLIEINPFLADLGSPHEQDRLIEANRQAVLDHYSQKAYRNRLLEIYRRVAHEPAIHRIDKQALLSRFLSPEYFSLLRWNPHQSDENLDDKSRKF